MDDWGNEVQCTFNVEVVDTIVPTLTACPADIVIYNNSDSCGVIATWMPPVAMDDCSGVALLASHNSGDEFFPGINNVIYRAEDPAGNVTFCNFTVLVHDIAHPEISNCPPPVNIFNDPGTCAKVVNWPAPSATDNCGLGALFSNYGQGYAFPVGTTTVQYTAIDVTGNTTLCVFDVTVNDTESPFISNCPADTTLPSDSGLCGAVYSWPTILAIDCLLYTSDAADE